MLDRAIMMARYSPGEEDVSVYQDIFENKYKEKFSSHPYITDMERIGDQTSDIADIIIGAGMSEAREIPVIGKMAEATSKMVNDSVLAYVNKDLELARKVMLADDEVDKLFDQTKQKLVKLIAEDHGNQGEKAIDLIMITKYLERIGDHATNIAEWVEFSITGVHKGMTTV